MCFYANILDGINKSRLHKWTLHPSCSTINCTRVLTLRPVIWSGLGITSARSWHHSSNKKWTLHSCCSAMLLHVCINVSKYTNMKSSNTCSNSDYTSTLYTHIRTITLCNVSGLLPKKWHATFWENFNFLYFHRVYRIDFRNYRAFKFGFIKIYYQYWRCLF